MFSGLDHPKVVYTVHILLESLEEVLIYCPVLVL